MPGRLSASHATGDRGAIVGDRPGYRVGGEGGFRLLRGEGGGFNGRPDFNYGN
jgi:hypothetical protein